MNLDELYLSTHYFPGYILQLKIALKTFLRGTMQTVCHQKGGMP